MKGISKLDKDNTQQDDISTEESIKEENITKDDFVYNSNINVDQSNVEPENKIDENRTKTGEQKVNPNNEDSNEINQNQSEQKSDSSEASTQNKGTFNKKSVKEEEVNKKEEEKNIYDKVKNFDKDDTFQAESMNVNKIDKANVVNILQNHPDVQFKINKEKILENEIKFLKDRYIKIRNYEQFKKELQGNNLLLCYGKKGIGKYSTVLYALSEIDTKKSIYILYNVNDLKQLLTYIEKDTTYIIDNININFKNNNSFAILDDLNRKLLTIGSKLVIVLSMDYLSNSFYDSGYFYRIDENEEKYEILIKHIQFDEVAESDRKEALIQKLNECESKELINSKLYARDATRLAKLLLDERDREVNVLELLQEFLKNDIVNNEINQMLQENVDLDVIVFLISLAVFENNSYRKVLMYAKILKEEIKKECNNDEHLESLNKILSSQKKDKIDKVHAVINKKQIGSTSNIYEDYVKFKNPFYAKEVLKYLWNEYDLLYYPIRKWLEFLSKYEEESVINAFITILKEDFDYISINIIGNWINEIKENKIQLSTFIDLASKDEDLKHLAISYFELFYNSKDLDFNMVAIHALGKDFGKCNPKNSINLLFQTQYLNISSKLCNKKLYDYSYMDHGKLLELCKHIRITLVSLFYISFDIRRYILKKIAYTLQNIRLFCTGEIILSNTITKLFVITTDYKNIKIPIIIDDYVRGGEYQEYVKIILFKLIDNQYWIEDVKELVQNYIEEYKNQDIVYDKFVYFIRDLVKGNKTVQQGLIIDLLLKLRKSDASNKLLKKIFDMKENTEKNE